MVKLIAGCSPLLVAATVAVTAMGQAPVPSPQRVMAVGCVVRNGTVDVSKGVRQLNIEPNALALTNARITSTDVARPSAVPGSQPEGTNSGTIPNGTIVGRASGGDATLSLALVGTASAGLGQYVGRRVEVVGKLMPASPDPQTRGTTGAANPKSTDQGKAAETGASTAHPSAEIQRLEVASFRDATGSCD